MTGRKRGAPKPKLGRPTLPHGEVKEVFAIRISKIEREAIATAAERAGKPLAQWAREVLLKHSTK